MRFKSDFTTYARQVAEILPDSASEILSTEEGGKVKPSSILVYTNKSESLMDQNAPDILIIVRAHNYEERTDRSKKIGKNIKRAAKKFLKGRSKKPVIKVITDFSHMDYA